MRIIGGDTQAIIGGDRTKRSMRSDAIIGGDRSAIIGGDTPPDQAVDAL